MLEALVFFIMIGALVLTVIAALYFMEIRDAWKNGDYPEEFHE